MGISQAIISATIVALGTSLPELSTTYASSKKGHGGLAIGNVIGANIMNLLLVLGTSIFISPNGITISSVFYYIQFPFMMVALFFVYSLIFSSKRHQITKKEGSFLLLLYLTYLFFNIFIH